MSDESGYDEDFLDRMDFEDEAFENDSTMRTALDELFQSEYGVDATDKQVSVFFEAGDLTRVKFAEVGIERRVIKFGSGAQTRYKIPFQKGWFGFAKALSLFHGLTA